MKIYLDNAATTPLNQETKNYIISILDDYYNPSSAYQEGRNIRNKIVSAKYCYITHELRLHQNDRCKRFTPV